jgi:hypothetical protein
VNRYYFPRFLLSHHGNPCCCCLPRGYLWSCRLRAVSAPQPDTCGDRSASSCSFPYQLYLNTTPLAWIWAPVRSLFGVAIAKRTCWSEPPALYGAKEHCLLGAVSALILVGVPVLVPPSRHPVSYVIKVLHVKGHASNHGLFTVIQRYRLI